MEEPLKARLIGASILVLLAVALAGAATALHRATERM